jgi:circadian clock protein KaiC
MGTTTLVTSEIDPYDTSVFTEVATADTIIGIHYGLSGARARRGIDIIKSRGQESLSGLHELVISDAGVEVYPRLEARVAMMRQHSMHDLLRGGVSSSTPTQAATGKARSKPDKPVRFDLPELDKLLGGGFMRSTCTLIMGESGTGKTTFALQFALAGVRAGEPVLYLGFYETIDQLLIKADHLGYGADMRTALAPGGPLTMIRMEPVELYPDVIANQLLRLLDVTAAKRLIIDGASELEEAARSSGDGSRVAQYIAALLEVQRMRGITVLLTRNMMRTIGPLFDLTQQPLALAADNVIMLQHVLYRRSLHNMLVVLKTRFSAHDPGMREFTITEGHGLRVLTPPESRKDLLADTSETYGIPASGTSDSATSSSVREQSGSRARPSRGHVSHRPRFSRTETEEGS